MKARRKSLRSAVGPAQWALECLEERTLLTGNVIAAVMAGGNLLVLGDSKANQIGIQSTGTPGALKLTGQNGTTINGSSSPFTASGVTGSVAIFLGQGNDVLDIGGGTPQTTISQNLLIVLGNGKDTVDIATASIGGNLSIFGGSGGDTVAVGRAAASTVVSVGGNLLINGGAGNSTLAVFDANVTGNLTLIGNGASDHIQVGYDAGLGIIGDESTSGHVNVGGNLTITDMPESTQTTFGLFAFGFSGFSFSGGGFGLAGFDAFETLACAGDPSALGFNGCVSLANLSGTDLFSANCGTNFSGLFDSIFGFGACGTSSTATRGGEHVAVADVMVTGNLSIQTGSGSDEILIGEAHTPATDQNPLLNLVPGPVYVTGNLKVSSGAGNDTQLLVQVTVAGTTALDTGAGNDDVGVLQMSSFTGAFTIRGGRGNDSIVIATNMFAGSVSIYGGAGTDTIGLGDSLFNGPVVIKGGPGNDTYLEIEGFGANTFTDGLPVLNSIETQSDVSATDFEAAFPWISSLLFV